MDYMKNWYVCYEKSRDDGHVTCVGPFSTVLTADNWIKEIEPISVYPMPTLLTRYLIRKTYMDTIFRFKFYKYIS